MVRQSSNIIESVTVRDKKATRSRLIQALGSLLSKQGFTALVVNAVAREAGVDKVLIYSYFGGLPDLIAASEVQSNKRDKNCKKFLYWIDTGRKFERLALMARERNIAVHPMTQYLEEKEGQKQIADNHEAGVIPQFVIRVGYLSKYPDPVSPWRPVSWFVKSV